MKMKKYYEAYEQRYKTIHEKGFGWFADTPTQIVFDVINRYDLPKDVKMLEIGCGEGRDAIPLLKRGYGLYATDISTEAVSYCKKLAPEYEKNFAVLDCLNCADTSCTSKVVVKEETVEKVSEKVHENLNKHSETGYRYFILE